MGETRTPAVALTLPELTVYTDVAMGAPELQKPDDGAVLWTRIANPGVRLIWSTVVTGTLQAANVSYIVEISRNQDFVGPTTHAVRQYDDGSGGDQSVVIANADYSFDINATYYWRVMALHTAGGQSDKSEARSFTLSVPEWTGDEKKEDSTEAAEDPDQNDDQGFDVRSIQIDEMTAEAPTLRPGQATLIRLRVKCIGTTHASTAWSLTANPSSAGSLSDETNTTAKLTLSPGSTAEPSAYRIKAVVTAADAGVATDSEEIEVKVPGQDTTGGAAGRWTNGTHTTFVESGGVRKVNHNAVGTAADLVTFAVAGGLTISASPVIKTDSLGHVEQTSKTITVSLNGTLKSWHLDAAGNGTYDMDADVDYRGRALLFVFTTNTGTWTEHGYAAPGTIATQFVVVQKNPTGGAHVAGYINYNFYVDQTTGKLYVEANANYDPIYVYVLSWPIVPTSATSFGT